MARIGSFVVSLAAVAAVCAAILVAVRSNPEQWRGFVSGFVRFMRQESNHPRWDVLAQ
jgi:hypothetical protein